MSTSGVPRLVADWSRSAVAGLVMAAFVVVLEVVALVTGERFSGLVVTTTSSSVLLGAYQLLTWWRFRGADPETLARWARATTPRTQREVTRARLLGSGGRDWTLLASSVALVAVVGINARPETRTDAWAVGTSLVLVAVAWSGVVVGSPIAYLREHVEHPGLELPGGAAPDWSDLVYLAVQVSTTFSTSDVTVTSRRMRRLVTTHGLVAFVFNTVIVAVLVSSILSATA